MSWNIPDTTFSSRFIQCRTYPNLPRTYNRFLVSRLQRLGLNDCDNVRSLVTQMVEDGVWPSMRSTVELIGREYLWPWSSAKTAAESSDAEPPALDSYFCVVADWIIIAKIRVELTAFFFLFFGILQIPKMLPLLLGRRCVAVLYIVIFIAMFCVGTFWKRFIAVFIFDSSLCELFDAETLRILTCIDFIEGLISLRFICLHKLS